MVFPLLKNVELEWASLIDMNLLKNQTKKAKDLITISDVQINQLNAGLNIFVVPR